MYMGPSGCVKRIHQFSLRPVLCLLLGSGSLLTRTSKIPFAVPFVLYTHTPDNGVSCIWSAAKGTLWYFSSLNSLLHKIFVAKTEKNCLSRAGSEETLLDGVLHCYLFLTPAMFGSSNTTKHSYFIPYLKSYLRIIQRCPFIQSPVLQHQG